MKTLIIAWVAALLLYSITSVVTAADVVPVDERVLADERVPAEEVMIADYMDIWSGFSEGNVCITIQDRIDSTDARAELWLVNNYEVEWIKDVEGYSCFDMDIDDESNLHVITYDPRIIISVVAETDKRLILTSL